MLESCGLCAVLKRGFFHGVDMFVAWHESRGMAINLWVEITSIFQYYNGWKLVQFYEPTICIFYCRYPSSFFQLVMSKCRYHWMVLDRDSKVINDWLESSVPFKVLPTNRGCNKFTTNSLVLERVLFFHPTAPLVFSVVKKKHVTFLCKRKCMNGNESAFLGNIRWFWAEQIVHTFLHTIVLNGENIVLIPSFLTVDTYFLPWLFFKPDIKRWSFIVIREVTMVKAVRLVYLHLWFLLLWRHVPEFFSLWRQVSQL